MSSTPQTGRVESAAPRRSRFSVVGMIRYLLWLSGQIISGSFTGVVGLPLFETKNLLTGLGWRP